MDESTTPAANSGNKPSNKSRGKGEALPNYAKSYFRHLVGEYHALPANSEDTPAYKNYIARIKEIIKEEKGGNLDWDDLFQFELCLLRMQPQQKLRRKAWIMRLRYRDFAGSEAYQAYINSEPPKVVPGTNQEEELLADLEVLLEDSFWHSETRRYWEEERKFFNYRFAALALLGLASVVVLIHYSNPISTWLTMLTVTLTGAMGGLISMMRRLQSISDEAERLSSLVEMKAGRVGILLQAPISGAIFANVLFWMFVSGLLKGDLFPEFSVASGESFTTLLGTQLVNGIQFFKVLVWSFVAGFAERFVPDILDRVAAKGQTGADSKVK